MHLKIVPLICCGLLIAYGYAQSLPSQTTTERKCSNNVPQSVRKTLLEVLNNRCSSSNGYKLSNENYICKLGLKAFSAREGHGRNAPFFFDGKSTFEFEWEKSLGEAVQVADNNHTALSQPVTVMCGLLSKNIKVEIGCGIKLSTSNETGAHELNLRCNYRYRI
ncbi:hypothetical protein V3C99_014251 [Haemonchus contortus]